MQKPPKHILVIRFSAMGDVALTVPVLRAFVEQYPQVKLTVLTRKHFKPILRDLKHVEVFTADLDGKHKGFFGMYRLSRELKSLQVEAVADLHNVIRTKLLKIFLTGKPFISIDKGREEKKALVSGKAFHQLKPTHQRYADVFAALGYPINLLNPSFPERKELDAKTIAVVGKDTKKWIGIAPFATYKSKMYPEELMEQVVQELSKDHKILLFGGGKSETEKLAKWESKFENVVSVAGKLPFDKELDIISNLDVMLSMDSGNGHLAAMLGVKTITLWGVTHPFAGFYPFHQDWNNKLLSDRNQYPKIPTSVYGNKFPEGYEDVMKTISPSIIIEKVNKILQ